jgi:expansin (peptidoglycan-binding protein)
MNVDHFEIERSQNGQQFTTAGMVNAEGNGKSGKTDYNWIDPSPLTGTSFYRVKEIDIDGESKYSSVVRIDIDQDNYKLNLFPNPVVNKKVSVQANIEKGRYNIMVSNLDGKKIYDQVLDHNGGIISQSIQLPSTISPGIYLFTIRGNGVKILTQFVVK